MNEESRMQVLAQTVDAFKASSDRAKYLIDAMKNEQVRKVTKAFLDFPLNDTPPRFSRKDENELFVLLVQTQEYKKSILSSVEDLKPSLEKRAAEGVAMEMLEDAKAIAKKEVEDGKVE